jgi:hypothetical protein
LSHCSTQYVLVACSTLAICSNQPLIYPTYSLFVFDNKISVN